MTICIVAADLYRIRFGEESLDLLKCQECEGESTWLVLAVMETSLQKEKGANMKQWLLALSGIALFGATVPTYADFMIDPNPTGEKLFIDKANKDVSSFSGIVGSNVSGPIVDVTTLGNVDTGSGFSNIKPVK